MLGLKLLLMFYKDKELNFDRKTSASLTFLPNKTVEHTIELSNVSSIIECGDFKLHDFLARYLSGDESLKSARSISRKRLALVSTGLICPDLEALTLYVQQKRYIEAKEYLKSQPQIQLSHLLEINSILSPDSKNSGKIRKTQNCLRATNKKITYTPPAPQEVKALLLNLVSFINNESYSPLTRAITAHCQLALIHPFHDGNGRVARVLWDVIVENAQLDLINPMIYRLQNTSAPYIQAVDAFGSKSFEGTRYSFWEKSIEWGEVYKQRIKILIENTQQQIQLKTMLFLLTNEAQQLLNHLWKQPLVHLNNISETFNWSNKICIQAILELQKYGLVTPRNVKHPQGEVVYECQEILTLWHQLEDAIFN